MQLVLDASVAVKWFLDEPDSGIARALPLSGFELIAPDTLLGEMANALWNAQRRNRLDAAAARRAVALFAGIKVSLIPAREVLPSAFEVAVTHGRTVYDSLYIALAIREDCQFVTADLRLYNALRDEFPDTVALLADLGR